MSTQEKRTYYSWSSMKQRCYNPRSFAYHRYGGRGIKVCERWLGTDGYKNFLKDMGLKPFRKTLDRINNDGNYEPQNCRWATRAEQADNTSVAVRITHNGKTQSMGAWAREVGLKENSK